MIFYPTLFCWNVKMRKYISYLVFLVGVSFLITWYASNYYSEQIENISYEQLQGKWRCKLAMGYRNGSLTIDYDFHKNKTFEAMYNIVVFGDLSKRYEIAISGNYKILKNKVNFDSEKFDLIKDDGTFSKIFSQSDENNESDNNQTDLTILKLTHNKLIYTTDTVEKKLKYVCDRTL